jgi:Ser/Thr protein kinase RdoA (MazF antagonist)
VVVQLKDNEVDTTKTVLANSLLGDVVPIAHGAMTKAQFAYVSRFIPGTVWALQEDRMSVDTSAKIARQVGSLLARCTLALESSAMVDRYIVPRLHKIISKADMPGSLRNRIRELVGITEGLKALPLALSHTDVNTMNIIINEKAEIVGLIDWELAQLSPVGMNAWCIRYLSVDNKGRVDYLSEKTQPMAEAFWDGFVASLPDHLQALKKYMVDAMMIGLVLDQFSEGSVPDARDLAMTMERLRWIEDTFKALIIADP